MAILVPYIEELLSFNEITNSYIASLYLYNELVTEIMVTFERVFQSSYDYVLY
jgi:hypothetical protein